MKCSRCQHENPSALKFCGECGARLAVVCASCGAANAPEQKFCGECGSKLSAGTARAKLASPDSYTPQHLAEKILTSKSALEGERKQVTVLFADLKGSMELLADRDPEEARKILDPVLECMMEAVHHYEGTVNQVMGDGIMALFGAPLAHEDHAVRACYAALRMHERVRQYAEGVWRSEGLPVQIRVGVNSGEVVVRSIGGDLHMDYTAVGQTTHLAARMEQRATPGTTLVSAETLRLAEGYVQVKALGPVPVKGLPGPVEVFELTGAGQARTRLQAAALRGLTRFVGRDAEVEHLRRVLTQADAGRGQVVAIVGEAGVGKSRLTYEFTHSHRVQDWLILEASSVSYGKATSYLPVIDLLKGYFKIGDRDDLREMREKVTGKLFTLDESLRAMLPALLALLDVPVEDSAWTSLDPPQRRQRTLDAVKRLLLRESQVQPLLVVFEDLHWIDGESQALLDSIVETLGSARLLVLVNYRPEYEHRWGSKTAYSQLRLDSLPAESAQELLGALLGPDPGLAPLTQMLVKRGNPFFLEETVRTLVETGALAGERGAYRLGRPVESLQVPARVQTILAARIDRLPTEEKQLLQAGSVIGKDVPYALLAAIAEQPDDILRRGLAHLQEAEFVYETQLFPDLEYTFKHALTHEVAYQSLLHNKRRSIHARIMSAIETLYAGRLDEHVERLAHHALRAEAWPSAIDYLRQVGLKAAARSANQEAVAWFEQALGALAHLPEERGTIEHGIDIRIDLRNALLPLGELPRILERLKEADQLAQGLGDQRRSSRIASRLAHTLLMNGDPQSAVESAHYALEMARALADPTLAVSARVYLGYGYYGLGDYRRGIDWLRQNLEALGEYPDGERFGIAVAPSILSRYCLVLCLSELGEFSEARVIVEEVLRIADVLAQPYGLTQAYWAAGYLHLRKGEVERAVTAFERTQALSRDCNVVFMTPISAAHLGTAYVLSGRLEDAVPLLERALQEAAAMGLLASPWLKAGWLSEAYLLCGRRSEALELALQTLNQAVENRKRGDQAWLLHLLAEIARHADAPEIDAAQTRFQEAMALAGELGMRPLVAHCHFGLAKLDRQTNNREQAREHLMTAITMYREMGMQFWLEKAEVDMRGLA
jgi:class 3 adenylate cyclase/tetratricopeptide (TPR) repeat protein